MTDMKFFAILFFALAPLLVRAGGDEVVVIYNTRVPESEDCRPILRARRGTFPKIKFTASR